MVRMRIAKIKYSLKQDDIGYICEPFEDKPIGLDTTKETMVLYRCGWGDTREEAIAMCKERNGW